MCGAFEQHGLAMRQWAAIIGDWPAQEADGINIRPTDTAVTFDTRGFALRKWSLVPPWAKEPKLKFATFNARAESLAAKPSFRDAWRRSQRCVIPVSAYFEWPVRNGRKQCHRVSRPNNHAILLGGLWETWGQGELQLDTFTIITTAAAGDIAWVHARTPLLIDANEIERWLRASPEEAELMLLPSSETGLSVIAVESPRSPLQ